MSDFMRDCFSAVGTIATVIGALFGGVAVVVTLLLYNRGIRTNRKKVLRQLGMEFTTVFIIPFSDLMNVLNNVLVSPIEEIKVQTIYDVLSNIQLSHFFPYWEANEGEIWDLLTQKYIRRNRGVSMLLECFSFEKKKESVFTMMNIQSRTYKNIRNFVNMAQRTNKGIGAIKGSIKEYLEQQDNNIDITVKVSKKHPKEDNAKNKEKTLDEYLKYSQQATNFYRGINILDCMVDCIKELPCELLIEENMLLLHGSLDFPKLFENIGDYTR